MTLNTLKVMEAQHLSSLWLIRNPPFTLPSGSVLEALEPGVKGQWGSSGSEPHPLQASSRQQQVLVQAIGILI